MEELFSEFLHNPLSIGLAIFSLILTYVLWRRGLQRKRISFQKQKYTLIRNNEKRFDKIKLMYDSKEVDSVAVTNIAIWNSGTVLINGSDMVQNRELRIKYKEKILDVKLLGCVDETNMYDIHLLNENEAVINFDYSNVGEGAVFQIIHVESDTETLQVDCKLKGGEKIKEEKVEGPTTFTEMAMFFVPHAFLSSTSQRESFKNKLVVVQSIFAILSLSITFACVIMHFDSSLQNIFGVEKKYILPSIVALGCTYSAIFMPALDQVLKRLFNIGIPRKLASLMTFAKENE